MKYDAVWYGKEVVLVLCGVCFFSPPQDLFGTGTD